MRTRSRTGPHQVTTAPILATSQIAKRFGSVIALRSVDLQVARGEVHALLGANGAGKSTLVKILSGVHQADSGEIRVDGESPQLRNPSLAREAGLATVFQDPALIPDLTVSENLRLTDVSEKQVGGWLERMQTSRVDFDQQIRDLPLPTLRLIDLARALCREPALLILDEMTAALPADQAEEVFAVMDEWRQKGRSVLFITHRLGEVLRMCDRATVLRDGRNVAMFEPRQVGEAGLVEAMLGEAAQGSTLGSQGAMVKGPIALEIRELRSGDKLNGASLQLHAGEVLGIAALEGQGQDRLFALLAGDRPPDSGEILVAGQPLVAQSPHDAVREGMVLIPSDRLEALLPQRSIGENLAIPLYRNIGQWWGLAMDEKKKVQSAIDRLSIDTRAGRQAGRLSGGNQQKVVVGRWLAAGFKVLLCFDPTRGIDVRTKQQIYELLRELAAAGAAILLYTSELAEIPLVCDRVLVLYDGRVVARQEASAATEESLLTAAHGLSPDEVA